MCRRTVSTLGIFILAIAGLAHLSGCGSTGAINPPPNIPASIAVTVTPTNASVQVGQSLQFIATVQNDPANKGVTWQIGNPANATCTPALCGTIDQSGKYTAPAAVSINPAFATIAVEATSIADSSESSNSSLVTIAAAPGPPIAVTVTPTNVSVQVGQSLQFTATVQNDPANKGVTWHIGSSGDTGCTPTLCGTIDANGRYTAPLTVPTNPDLVAIPIIAISVTDPNKFSASSLVTLTPAPDSVLVSPSAATIHIFGVPNNSPRQLGVTSQARLSFGVYRVLAAPETVAEQSTGTVTTQRRQLSLLPRH